MTDCLEMSPERMIDALNNEIRLRDAEIERLRAALQTIDDLIPKRDLHGVPAPCLVAGDVAETALNGTWPAFKKRPRHD